MNDIKFRLSEKIKQLYETTTPQEFHQKVTELISEYDVTPVKTKSGEGDILIHMDYFLSAKRYEDLANGTLENYERTIRKLYISFPNYKVSEITLNDLRNHVVNLDGLKKSSSRNSEISRIKAFFAWLKYEDYIVRDPALKLKLSKEPALLKRGLTIIELEKMRNACETTRERALIELLFATGCRISEIQGLNIGEINFEDNTIRLIGKGSKERIVCFTEKSSYYLEQYFNEHPNYTKDSAIFVSERKPHQRLKRRALQVIIKKVADRTDIDISVHPHRFRHTMATLSLQSGVDLTTVQTLLGHSSPDQTLIYAKQSLENIKHEYRKHLTH